MVAHINKPGPPTTHINGNILLRLSCKNFVFFLQHLGRFMACIVNYSVSFGFVAADGWAWGGVVVKALRY
jgi:hypothetical protein